MQYETFGSSTVLLTILHQRRCVLFLHIPLKPLYPSAFHEGHAHDHDC